MYKHVAAFAVRYWWRFFGYCMSKSHVRRVRELYKLILRLHRNLPDDLKILGDNYAREEFKRHKKCKPQEAQIFLNEWREYVVSMSRQAAPARPQRHPADQQQAGLSRVVRAVVPGQAAAGGRKVRAADQGQAAAEGGEGIAADQRRRTAGDGEGRAADKGQAAAGGGERRAADQQGQAGVREASAAAANALTFQAAAAGAHSHFGNNLDLQRIQQFTSDQLLTLYHLLMTARGENSQAEYGNDLIDIGIGLIEADVYSKSTKDAKKQILKMEEGTENVILGEKPEPNIYFNKSHWLKMFEEAQIVKNTEELRLAIESLEKAEAEAKMAKISLGIAEMEFDEATKLSDEAFSVAKNAKTAESKQNGTDENIKSKLHDTVTKAEKNAVQEVKKAKELNEKVLKLSMIAKSKANEVAAALNLTKEILKDYKVNMQKSSKNPDNS